MVNRFFRLNVTTNEYHQFLHCPKLVSCFNFEAQQNTDKPVLRGKGTAKVVACEYLLLENRFFWISLLCQNILCE